MRDVWPNRLTYYLVAAALSIHQHIQHPGTRHVRTAGYEGRITLRVAHVVGFGIEPSFFPALIVVAGTQVSLFTSQPCVVFGERGGGGGGGGGICLMPKMARRVHSYCTR